MAASINGCWGQFAFFFSLLLISMDITCIVLLVLTGTNLCTRMAKLYTGHAMKRSN